MRESNKWLLAGVLGVVWLDVFGPGDARAAFVYVADQSQNAIRRYNPDGTFNALALTGGTLNSPWGVALDGSGNIYVADGGSNSVKRITAAGAVTTFATGNGLNSPRGLVFDSAGNLYVANSTTNGISKFDSAGNALAFTLNTSAATVSNIDDMAFDSGGNLFVASQGTGHIRKISIAGTTGTVTNFATLTGNALGIAVDASDNVYFTAPSNFGTTATTRLVKFNSAGVQQTFTLTGVGLTSPGDLALGAGGQNLLVQQDNGSVVYRVQLSGSGGTVTTFSSTGTTNGRGIVTDAVIPEPTSLGLLGLGALGLLSRRRRTV